MPRGRSAISVHSDSSDMDLDALAEAEISKLQRQFRIMEGDRQAYSVQSQELIRKQRLEIEKLRKEHEELQKNLRVSESQSRKQADSHDAQQLRTLLNRRNELEQQLERERLSQAELEREIQSIQKKLEVLRKGDVGTFHSQKSQALHIQKATRTLENKLDRALIRFNQQLVKNSQLREELETLRVERVRFQQLHRKLEKELQEIRREIGDVIGMSTAAYDARMEAQTKMTMMKEKAVKDLAQYNAEIKELERLIAHEQRLKDFMTTKCNESTGLDNVLSHKHEIKEQQRNDSEVAAETLEEVFQRIKKVTGEDDLEMLVTKFIQAEDRNFALFNYVNEQNTNAETLKDEIRQIKEDMERFEVEDQQQEQEHHTTLNQTKEQQRDTEAQALEYEAQAKETTEILDQIKSGVSSLFNKINCDRAEVDDLLGSSSGIRDSNIMTYLKLVEQKTNELLTVQAFISSKDREKYYDAKLVAQVLLGQSAEMQKQAPVIQPPVSGDDYDTEELLLPHDDERPLTHEELRQCIMNRILQKEEALHAGKSKEVRSSKLSALSSHRQHTHEFTL
ncbi:coiled-coil domain-containing protein 114 isoform X1 [Tachysurus fulvidraco]|uniref:coiled-coil domain-containing protein 114 isoform X1 n=1 Tax=Tachysurus fulvidraco TaxID=1234273 RepID=UPI001FED5326|nr:coiled-coil domain-containing protein 114 isoform X1 [Tachysurus fulvidraco]